MNVLGKIHFYNISLLRKKLNTAGLRLLSLERSACKVGQLLASENLRFQEDCYQSLIRTAHCVYVVYGGHLLPFWESENLVHAGWRAPT